MTAHRPLSPPRELRRTSQPRRGLSREEAAVYLGISPAKFDQGVASGQLPKARTGGFLGARKVWDVLALDRAWEALPDEETENPWDNKGAASE